MVVAFLGFLVGAFTGYRAAVRRKGKIQDLLLYATVHGMIFALAGLFLAIAYAWLAS